MWLDGQVITRAAACASLVVTSLVAGCASGPPIEGRLRLSGPTEAGQFVVHHDPFGIVTDGRLAVRSLPAFDVEFVQAGSELLPVRRESIAGDHPSWEWVLAPGRMRPDPLRSGVHRALVPFALQERNANCVHYGTLELRFRAGDAGSRATWRITAETCAYFSFDAQGESRLEFLPGPVRSADAVREERREELARRLPVRDMDRLAVDHGAADPGDFGSPDEVPPGSMTAYGVVVDGIHYAGGCHTRSGSHPSCDELPLPSYSLAKSLFAGLALMRLEARYRGAGTTTIAELVPECAAAGWVDVTIAHAIDMATGRYEFAVADADENAAIVSDLFVAEDHATRIRYACGHYPRREAPGRQFVYHTSDTYVAGTAMTALLQRREGAKRDLHRDLLVEDVFLPLGLSPVTRSTRRTRDPAAQPFTGWGLLFQRDDIARLASWIASSGGVIDGRQVLDPGLLDAALQRRDAPNGLPAGEGLRYRAGFWAYDVAGIIGCERPVWVPFMSGYGGIVVAMFPNGVIYYYFSDGNTWRWRRAVIGADRLRPLCTAA